MHVGGRKTFDQIENIILRNFVGYINNRRNDLSRVYAASR